MGVCAFDIDKNKTNRQNIKNLSIQVEIFVKTIKNKKKFNVSIKLFYKTSNKFNCSRF